MHRNASEDSAGSGGTTSSQKMGTISLVVTSEESLAAPRYEPVGGSGASDDSGSIRERQRTNAYPGKTYGATTDMRVCGGLTVVDTHLALHPTHGTMRTRRVTVHNFADLSELHTLSKELTAGTPGLSSHHHSCSIINTSTEKTTAFHSNKLFAACGRKRRAGNWRSCDDINNAKRASLGSETMSPSSGGLSPGGLSYNSDASHTLVSHLDVETSPTPRLTSVTSCCSFGHTASTDSVHAMFDDRSTQSDPAGGGKDKEVFPKPSPRPVLSDFPTFVFESDEMPVTPCEDLSFLKRLRRTKGYGSSYRGLVSGGEAPGAGGSGDPDKDSIETGSISTMQTLQFELMDNTPAWRILAEVVIPFLMAGIGMVVAGLLLDSVQHWDVFTHISEVFILVPALLGLKGNLEMTLASRLSTQANLGNMDSTAEQWKMIAGNLALTQAQAIVVGFLAALAAMILGWIPEGKFDINHGFLLCCSSVLTAAFASFVLGTVMILVVLLSRKCHVNPDNVATPIAASLGDLTTLALLSGISSIMYKAIDNNNLWLAPTLLFIFLALTPLWCIVSHRNKYTHEILYSGWTPVIGAMVISSLGGLILDFAVGNYRGIAVFQPVINGVGGNLVAVQASRLSTALHRISTPGNLPEGTVAGCPNVFRTFFGSGVNARTARVLMLLVVPGHLIFMYTIHYMHAGHTSITITFAAVYLCAATLQVFILLYIANWLVHWLWKRGNDPDNFSIPYLTALGDLLGTGFLALAFHFLYVIGDRDADVGD